MKNLTPYNFGFNELSKEAWEFYTGSEYSFFIDEEGYYIANNTKGLDAWYIGSNMYEVNDTLEDLNNRWKEGLMDL